MRWLFKTERAGREEPEPALPPDRELKAPSPSRPRHPARQRRALRPSTLRPRPRRRAATPEARDARARTHARSVCGTQVARFPRASEAHHRPFLVGAERRRSQRRPLGLVGLDERKGPRPSRRSSSAAGARASSCTRVEGRRREAEREGQVHGSGRVEKADRPGIVQEDANVRAPPHARVRHAEDPSWGDAVVTGPRHVSPPAACAGQFQDLRCSADRSAR